MGRVAAALRCCARHVPQARAHHRDRGAGRIAPRGAAPRRGVRRLRSRASARLGPRSTTSRRSAIDVELLQADVLDELSLVDVLTSCRPHEVYNLAVALVRPDVVAAARTHGGVRSRRLHGAARGDPARRRRDSLLPGVVERDLRRAARGSADRGDAARAGHAVRRRQGLRALHHAELPAPLRAARVVRDPLQPRVAAAAARLRHAQDLACGRCDQSRARARGLARRPRRAPRLGVRRATTFARCG